MGFKVVFKITTFLLKTKQDNVYVTYRPQAKHDIAYTTVLGTVLIRRANPLPTTQNPQII